MLYYVGNHLKDAVEALLGRALAAWRAVLALDPNDPAEIHFRLAQLLHRQGSPEARRQVLMALQFAPRFRKAHKLLLEIVRTTK